MPTGDPYCPKHGFSPCRCTERAWEEIGVPDKAETGFTDKADFLDVAKVEKALNAYIILSEDDDEYLFKGVAIEIHGEEGWQHIRMTGGDPFRNLQLKANELKAGGWSVNFANVTGTTVQLLATK